MRIVFMGTPEFAVPSLEALADAGYEVACAYTQPPRPAGRGNRHRLSPVHTAATAHAIPVRCPESLNDPAVQADFAALAPDVACVAAYGLLLPTAILDAPRHGCLNIHASLLPRWRGASPIQHAILSGDEETGISIMQMEATLDTGPVMLSASTPIGPTTTAAALHDTLGLLGARLIVESLRMIADGKARAYAQPDDGAVLAPKIRREHAELDWTVPAAHLERQIRAFTPWPGAFFWHRASAEQIWERIKVLAADVVDGDTKARAGTVLDDALTIACGRYALRPLRLQRAGRDPCDTQAFLRGYPIPSGTRLAPVAGISRP